MSKKKILGCLLAVVAVITTLVALTMCTEIVPGGYVAVVYNVSNGVQEEPLKQGLNWISPFQRCYEFSVGNEQLVLSKDSREGSDEDESFFVATKDNANIAISFQMSYTFDEAEVVNTFVKFKQMDGDDIVRTRVKTVLKSKISEVTKDYSMMELYSGSRDVVNSKLTEKLNHDLHEQFGINVVNATIIDVHPDEALKKTIADRVAALQRKQQAEAEQETIKVQNETRLLQAKAEAEEKRIIAEGNAEVTRINSQAQAEGHKILVQNLTPELIQKFAVDKWDGKVPVVTSGSSIIGIDGLNK